MMNKPSGKYRKFINDGKKYLSTRYDLLRLELLEKMSSIVAILILAIVGILLAISVWVYVSCILIILMERAFDSFFAPLIIMGFANLLLLVMIIILKEKLILNPLIKAFSKILFEHVDDDEDDDDEYDEIVKNDTYE